MILRRIASSEKNLYLTFDDGPHPEYTPKVMELLEKYKVEATFFLVAQKALKQKAITDKVQKAGHAIGNHSMDHGYKTFFLGKKRMLKWIEDSENTFKSLKIKNTIGFRPPNGIVTPELCSALKQLNIPLILWNTRFFDTVFLWKKKSAQKALDTIANGSIILLHDVQKSKNFPVFLETLEYFITEAKANGFSFKKLPNHN